MEIQMIDVNDLVIPDWQATYILRPDMVTLAASLMQYGILTPLIVRKADNLVIDGTQRIRIITGNRHIAAKIGKMVPVVVVDCDSIDAMLLHAQVNRGRGSLVAKNLSRIIREVMRSRKYKQDDVERMLAMKSVEFELMMDSTIIKQRDIQNFNYSRAWVPVEAPAGTVESLPVIIERPPGDDR